MLYTRWTLSQMRKDALKQDLPQMASLLVPVCDNTATAESETLRERPNAPLTMERMLLFRELYLGSRNSPAGEPWTASPIRAPLDLLRKCPETLIMIAGQDLLRGETFRFAWRFQEANVPVDIREYKGLHTPFMAMDGLLETGRRGNGRSGQRRGKNLGKVLGGFRRKTERCRQRV
jgi:acetyl esterase/lipase